MRTGCQSWPYVFSSLGEADHLHACDPVAPFSRVRAYAWHAAKPLTLIEPATSLSWIECIEGIFTTMKVACLGWANSNEGKVTSRRARRL